MNQIGIEATFELTLRGPLLVHSSAIGPWGVDAVALRDSADHLIIPGDAVQGKLREAWDQIGGDPFGRSRAADLQTAVDDTDAARRESSYADNLNAPFDPYPLFFSDFRSVKVWPTPGRQTVSQTALDPDTGAAKPGSLRTYDCPVLPGEPACFAGQVRFFCRDGDAGRAILDRLCTALAWVLSFGSQKSIGFGRNVGPQGPADVRVVTQTVTRFSPEEAGKQGLRNARSVLVDFSFRDPLCLPSGVANGNTYESRDEIPGEALRGALAQLLKQIGGLPHSCQDLAAAAGDDHPFAILCRQFSRIRFTTARLARPGTTDAVRVLPRSWALADERLFDFALVDEQRALQLFNQRAAAFCHDWKSKERDAVNEHLGTVFPRQELRVRTAVESSQRRAKTHSLFAYRLLRPEGVAWRGTVSIDDRTRTGDPVSDEDLQTALDQCLTVLGSGWLSVGKTRARGTGKCVAANDRGETLAPVGPPPGLFVVTLRGPALMLDPRRCLEKAGGLKRMEEIDGLYAEYWNEVSGTLLTELPQHRFTQEALVGGFQARKYRYCPDPTVDLTKKPVSERLLLQKSFPYNPTLIVEAGSVFVLQVKDAAQLAAATELVKEWISHGLPLPAWAARAYGDTHQTNIFIPANGFGEVDVNLSCHASTFELPLATVGGRS